MPFIGFSQVRLHDWDNNFYNKYNSSTFQSLEIVHQLIDHNNIDYQLFNAAIFYRTNIERINYGGSPFRHSPALEKAAQGHSKDMVTYNFYSHGSPVRGKNSMTDRLNAVGLPKYRSSAENIHNDNLTNPTYWSFASSLVKDWMNSSGHRANILNNKYNYLGCGVYFDNMLYGDVWVKSTQNFSSIVGTTRETTNNTNTNTNNTIYYTKDIVNKKEIKENTLQENISYGNQMFVCDPVLLFSGSINVGYERFSNNNLLSYKFPLKIKYKNYRNNKNNDILRTGCELKIFPKGHDNIFSVFIAPADYLGLSFQQDSNKNEYYFFNEILLISGLNYHPIEWINITLDASFGIGTLNFNQVYHPFRVGLDIGIRY